MASENLSSPLLFSPAGRRDRPGRLRKLVLCVIAALAVVPSCSGQLPATPGQGLVVTISGYVYEQETPDAGEPLLINALITVKDAEGPGRTALTDGSGFYALSVRAPSR